MILVPTGISEVVLGMVDDRVVPVGDVDCSIRSDLAIDGTEVRVLGGDERRKDVCGEPRSAISEFISYDGPALEPAGKQLSADIFRKVGSRSEVPSALLFGTDEVIEPDSLAAVACCG